MNVTNIDQIIDFPDEAIKLLLDSQTIRNLLADKDGATLEDMEDDNGDLKYIFDYEYVEESLTETKSFICMETSVRLESGTINDFKLAIHVICHKEHMRLNHKVFKGIKGNRRDNLVREIQKVLQDNRNFGIGKLQLQEISPYVLPPDFAGKVIVYDVPIFRSRKVQ